MATETTAPKFVKIDGQWMVVVSEALAAAIGGAGRVEVRKADGSTKAVRVQVVERRPGRALCRILDGETTVGGMAPAAPARRAIAYAPRARRGCGAPGCDGRRFCDTCS